MQLLFAALHPKAFDFTVYDSFDFGLVDAVLLDPEYVDSPTGHVAVPTPVTFETAATTCFWVCCQQCLRF
jgi:hypothetical protein